VEDFLKEKPRTKYTYDITHKVGILLKHHLENDANWNLLVNKIGDTKRSLLHTILGFLAPPKPSDKSRWLNLDSYLDWAEKVLCFGKVNMECIEREKYDSKLAWLSEKDACRFSVFLVIVFFHGSRHHSLPPSFLLFQSG